MTAYLPVINSYMIDSRSCDWTVFHMNKLFIAIAIMYFWPKLAKKHHAIAKFNFLTKFPFNLITDIPWILFPPPLPYSKSLDAAVVISFSAIWKWGTELLPVAMLCALSWCSVARCHSISDLFETHYGFRFRTQNLGESPIIKMVLPWLWQIQETEGCELILGPI